MQKHKIAAAFYKYKLFTDWKQNYKPEHVAHFDLDEKVPTLKLFK